MRFRGQAHKPIKCEASDKNRHSQAREPHKDVLDVRVKQKTQVREKDNHEAKTHRSGSRQQRAQKAHETQSELANRWQKTHSRPCARENHCVQTIKEADVPHTAVQTRVVDKVCLHARAVLVVVIHLNGVVRYVHVFVKPSVQHRADQMIPHARAATASGTQEKRAHPAKQQRTTYAKQTGHRCRHLDYS